jgi:hypothetical protein
MVKDGQGVGHWEDKEALRQKFPNAPAWGQAGLQDPRDVSAPISTGLQSHRAQKANMKFYGLELAV